MRGRRRSSGIPVALLALLCVALASGCASLQQDGTIQKANEGDAGASQVQIWPSPPSGQETPAEIVSGFLEAARSGAPNQGIAARYLTADALKKWQTQQNTVFVLADYSESTPLDLSASGAPDPGGDNGVDPGENTGSGSTVVEQVQGNQLGMLAANGVYSAQSEEAYFKFTVQKTGDGYRISQLPASFGVLMERSDFEGYYTRHVVYYENPLDSGHLLPAQVYLPTVDTDQQVAEQAAKLVVDGVPPQLAQVMRNSVTGVSYQGLQVSSDNEATVTVKSGGRCARQQNCYGLARQLAQTLIRLNNKITDVRVLDRSSGQTSDPASLETGMIDYGVEPQLGADGDRQFYAISLTGQVEMLDTSGAVDDPDILKDPKAAYSSVSAAPVDQTTNLRRLALVSKDRATVSVAEQHDGEWQKRTVFPANGTPVGATVGRTGWDSRGDLWFTVTLNGDTSVYRYDSSGNSLEQVTLTGVQGTVNEVLPAPDADRVAVRFTAPGGNQSIVIAAVTETDGTYALDLTNAEYAASQWNSITDFDWYDEESLAVLGSMQQGQSLGLYQIYSDGSAVYDSLTSQPVQASPPGQAGSFVWTAAGRPIASSPSQGKNTLYTLSVEGQDAQPLGSLTGSSPSY